MNRGTTEILTTKPAKTSKAASRNKHETKRLDQQPSTAATQHQDNNKGLTNNYTTNPASRKWLSHLPTERSPAKRSTEGAGRRGWPKGLAS